MGQPAMLVALRVDNLAIVDRVELTFGRGLHVLTGETGAGKSILVDALSLLLGDRAQSDMVRAGAAEASVEAMIELGDDAVAIERFSALGIDVADGEVVIRRVISSSGRGRVTLNGQLATVAMLAEVTRGLIDISGQHEHVSLLDSDSHVDLVDAFGELDRSRSAVSEAHGEVMGLESALSSLELSETEKARREDFLRYQIEEIASVDPKPGELEAIETERRRLAHAARLSDGVRRAEGALYSEDSAIVGILGRIQLELVQLSQLDESLARLHGAASSALAELEELARDLAHYGRNLEADPARLTELDERHDALKKLVRKHGGSIEAVLVARTAMEDELEALVHEEARRADLSAALEAASERRAALAAELSAARGKSAKSMERAIQSELASLSMAQTTLKVELVRLPAIGAKGAERAEIMISPNPGEPLRPLHKTASGGELSRVLLATKRVLAGRDQVATYVFDEVDSGIGGAVAEVLGRKLLEVSREHQVFSVTHLPQVAAHADVHFRVEKRLVDGRTVSRVDRLRDDEAVEELARMLGGVSITARTRQLAKEMRLRSRSLGRDGAGEAGGAEPGRGGPLSRRPAQAKPGRPGSDPAEGRRKSATGRTRAPG
jgi:DNA repair protein RecN (Recombination protein N)